MTCKWCGSDEAYWRLDEDKPGRHVYQLVCRRCNHEGEPVEVLHPIAISENAAAGRDCPGIHAATLPNRELRAVAVNFLQTASAMWAFRILLLGAMPAAVWLLISLALIVNIHPDV